MTDSLTEARFLCGGCNVREPWEHRCHRPGCHCEDCAGRSCDCDSCREERILFNRCPTCGGLNPGDVSHARC